MVTGAIFRRPAALATDETGANAGRSLVAVNTRIRVGQTHAAWARVTQNRRHRESRVGTAAAGRPFLSTTGRIPKQPGLNAPQGFYYSRSLVVRELNALARRHVAALDFLPDR